jgi:hypothetical protein
MITLIPIEPRNDAHGMLIVEAFYNLFINWGGQSDGDGDGDGYGDRDGGGDGDGWGYSGKHPEEWIVKP